MDKKEILNITKKLPHIIGVAPNAFSRVILGEFFPNYSIVCFKYRGETDYISSDIDVFCVEKENPRTSISKMNAKEMLLLPEVRKFIDGKRDPHLLVYKPTKGIESIGYNTGWKFIANSSDVKYEIENKLSFRNLLEKAGIKAVTGETVLYDALDLKLYKRMREKYGEKLVFQICEMTSGGGTGTAFINSEADFLNFKEKFDAKREKLTAIENVNVTRFMEGIPSSIAACATKYGVITGRIQTQILDIPEVRVMSEGSGLFSGHDFTYGNYSDDLNRQAKEIAAKFGEYIYKNLGYKGIFGIDLITDTKAGLVYPIECNPRYTDAFPLLSEIHASSGAIPMDVFHVFEHMNIPYKIDVDEISRSYDTGRSASQILLETKSNDWTKVTGELKAGVYSADNQKRGAISYLRPGYRFEHLKSEDEFLVTEGVPFRNTSFKGGARILRLIFVKSILEKPKELTDYAKNVISQIYDQLRIEKTDAKLLVDDFFGLKSVEIPETRYIKKAMEFKPDIVDFLGDDPDFGYVRPRKILWEMEFQGSDTISHIRSVRMRKHIKKWIKDMDKYALSYEVIEPLTNKEFMLWFEKFQELLSSKEKANIKITPSWLKEKIREKKIPGAILIFKDKKLLGGNLYVRSDGFFNVGFGAVAKIKDPNWGLGTLADFLCVKRAQELGYKKIRFGIDTNLYGHHLSTGLLSYKLNFGLTPTIGEKAVILTSKFFKSGNTPGQLVFLGIKNEKFVFNILKDTESVDEPVLNSDLKIVHANFD